MDFDIAHKSTSHLPYRGTCLRDPEMCRLFAQTQILKLVYLRKTQKSAALLCSVTCCLRQMAFGRRTYLIPIFSQYCRF